MSFESSLDPLKPLSEVLAPDVRWQTQRRSLDRHYAQVSSVSVADHVPPVVLQAFETARNVWLYAYFAYRLNTAALLQVHVVCELALRTKVLQVDGKPASERENLKKLFGRALRERWLVDCGFAIHALQAQNWEKHRRLCIDIGEPDPGPFQPAATDQHLTSVILESVRFLRNQMAHGSQNVWPDLTPTFQAVADVVNQLFPAPCAATSSS